MWSKVSDFFKPPTFNFNLQVQLEVYMISSAFKLKMNIDSDAKFKARFRIISPTHKRTEGRVLVWGSEFTSKDAALQAGVGRIAARLNVELCDLLTAWLWHLTLFLVKSFTRVIRGCWFVLLYFAPCRPLPSPRRPLP
jgi:hypothetical protein